MLDYHVIIMQIVRFASGKVIRAASRRRRLSLSLLFFLFISWSCKNIFSFYLYILLGCLGILLRVLFKCVHDKNSQSYSKGLAKFLSDHASGTVRSKGLSKHVENTARFAGYSSRWRKGREDIMFQSFIQWRLSSNHQWRTETVFSCSAWPWPQT